MPLFSITSFVHILFYRQSLARFSLFANREKTDRNARKQLY